MDVRLPDGTIIRGVPDGITREELTVKLRANGYKLDEPAPEKGVLASIAGGVRDAAAGAVRGAGSIGATLLAPIDMASDAIDGKGLSLESNRARRKSMDDFMREQLGADTDSYAYGGGKLAAEVAGTLGAGGVLANGAARLAPAAVEAMPAFQAALNAVRTGGMTTGARPGAGFAPKAIDLATRVGGGAVNGLVSAGLANPEDAGMGAAVGGAIPIAAKVGGTVGQACRA